MHLTGLSGRWHKKARMLCVILPAYAAYTVYTSEALLRSPELSYTRRLREELINCRFSERGRKDIALRQLN